jgi:hypothetical protein
MERDGLTTTLAYLRLAASRHGLVSIPLLGNISWMSRHVAAHGDDEEQSVDRAKLAYLIVAVDSSYRFLN